MRVGLIGHGMWGTNLARNFHELRALACVVDSREEVRQAVRKRYPDIDVLESVEGMLQREELTAVVIATPAETHFELARSALEAGKDVFVEKPLALRVQEGKELVALAEARGRILMVGHLMEYHPAVARIRELVQAGELGQIQYIYSNRLNWGKVRREENILWSFAPHDIAIILGLLGEMPESVYARGGNYLQPHIADVTVTTLDFRSGVQAHIFVSWLHPYKEQRLVVIGDKKVVCFDDTSPEQKLMVYPHRIEWVDRVPVARKANGEALVFDDVEPLRVECQAFLDACTTRTPPLTDGVSALRVLQVLEDSQSSLASGIPEAVGGSVPGGVEASGVHQTARIHPSAHVDPGAEVGAETRIWHGAHVMPGSRIGSNCILSQNVFVAGNVTMGDRVKVQNNVSVYEGVVLEDDVFCGPSMVFTNVRNPRAHVERKNAFEETRIQRGATLGANCTIRCGVTIGSYAFVGAGAVVTRDVEPHRVVVGNPARPAGWACACGEVLGADGAERWACARCGNQYEESGEGRGLQKVDS